MLSMEYILMLGAVLFLIGLVGASWRRDILGLVLAVVLITLGNVISLCAFDWSMGQTEGRVLALFLCVTGLG